jgi:hypothetical protein
LLDADVGVVRPAFTDVATPRDLAGTTFLGRLHSFDLDWTVLPRFEAGYTFGSGAAVAASYRFLSARGTRGGPVPVDGAYASLLNLPLAFGGVAVADPLLDRDLHGRLDEHWVDLDYTSAERSLGDAIWCRWTTGVRLASLRTEFQTQDHFTIHVRVGPDPTLELGSFPLTVGQRATQESLGAGPHPGLAGVCPFGTTGLALFGGADGGVLFAGNRQEYEITASAQVAGPGAGGVPVTFTMPPRSGTERGPGVIPTLDLRAGLDWSAPLGRSCVGLSAGYELGAWWFSAIGHGAEQNALFKGLDQLSHGPFVRCRLDF